MKKIYSKPMAYLLGLAALPCILEAQTSVTYSYTGAMESFTVPACVNSLTLDVRGSKGGDCIYNQPGTKPDDLGGLGGRVVAVYSVTPGQVLNIFVGGISYNGGGTGGGSIAQAGGGGASDIRIGGTTLADRIIVAGGGGGGGNNCSANAEPGGAGGGLTGAAGWQCGNQTGTSIGQGGTQSAGGAAGTSPATPGSLGQGGNAGGAGTASGGGGGGYYGGGGAAYGGGGGGSSYTHPSATSVVHTQGYQNGTGQVIISYGASVVPITSSSPNVCSGSTATLSSPGLQTYTWSTGATTPSIQVSPTVTTTYSLQGTTVSGCPAMGMISIGIIPSPTITASAASPSVCASNSTTLTASGNVSSYTWNTGATTASITVFPTVTTNYTVTGANTCGTATAAAMVSVNNGPVLSLPSSTVMCGSGYVILIAGTSANTYTWSTGAVSQSIAVSPSVTTSYSVTGSNACGTATAMTTVSLGVIPTVTAATSSATICAGSQVSLTAIANSVTSYSWSTGATSASITVSPTTTTVYTVTASSVCGTATASITQHVVACTGLNDMTQAHNILLYPNPAGDVVHISLSSDFLSGHTSIEITDALGKLVIKEPLTSNETILKLQGIEQGIYFYKVLVGEKLIQSGKILKY